MEVEPAVPSPPVANPELKKNENSPPAQPPLHGAYVPAGSASSRTASTIDGPSIFCIRCGTKVARTEHACPECGYPIHELFDDSPRARRRPGRTRPQPIRGYPAIYGAILIPLGLVLYLIGLAISKGFRQPGSTSFLVGIAFCLISILAVLTALGCFANWLYQAWRAVLREDEEHSPGLMVSLLFVPFFNFYWMYRAIPGLSLAIQQELMLLAPHRTNASGWGPGVAACVLALLPPLWPVAFCMFAAWILIADNAVGRLVRYHDRLQSDEWQESPGSVNGDDE